MSHKILAIPDTHHPWADLRALNAVYEICQKFKPTIIVQVGDLYDFFSFSRFPRSLNVISPKDEISRGRCAAETMWRNLQRASPKADCYQLMGNHCDRPIKKLISTFPEAETLMRTSELFQFPDVKSQRSERDDLIIGDILIQHGFRSKLGDHATHNHMKTICGHSHLGGVVYQRLGKKIIWELNCGFLAKEQSAPLSYTRQRQISKWTLGVGLVDELGPRFIPL